MIEPEISPFLHFFVDAFYTLTTERHGSMGGVMPIPWSSVIMYADMYCADSYQRNRLAMFIRAMDSAYCKHHNDKVSKQVGNTPKPSAIRKPPVRRR